MSATEAYLAALLAGDERALPDAEEKLLREQGRGALLRCLEGFLSKPNGEGGSREVVTRRLAAVLLDLAESRAADDAALASARAAVLYTELDDDAAADKATALSLSLSVSDEETFQRHVNALGGLRAATERVARRLKDASVKKDPVANAALRRVLASLAERDGDKERAFLEMLRAVRKVPAEPLYVDEVFRLCLAAEKHQELAAVLSELAEEESLDARHRATLWNKVGHLKEREQGDEVGALHAYRRSLALFPESKGARRHVERLARSLGEEEPRDEEHEIDDALVVESVPEAEAFGSREDTGHGRLPPPPPEPSDEGSPIAAELHESAADDDEPAITGKHAGADSVATLGSGDPTQQEVSAPSAEAAVTREAGRVPAAATALDEDEDEDEGAASLYAPPSLADPPPDHARHGEVGGDDDEEGATDRSRAAGEEASTVLETPGAATLGATSESPRDAASNESADKRSRRKRKRKKGKKAKGSATRSAAERPPAALTTEPAAEASAAERPPAASTEPAAEASSEASAAERPPAASTTEPAPEASSDASAAAPSAASEAMDPSDAQAREGDAGRIAAGDVVREPASESPSATTPSGIELPPATLTDDESAKPSGALDRTEKGQSARDVFAEADSLLGGDDVAACVETARELLEHPHKGSLVLRLAARALELGGADVNEEAIDLFVEEGQLHAPLTVSLARALFESLEEERRVGLLPVWVAAARAAGDDVQAARHFLEPFAALDAPHGMAFRQLDQGLAQSDELEARHALWTQALEQSSPGDEQRRRAILVGHIRFLQDAKEHARALPLYELLVTEVAPADEVLRERALAAFDAHEDGEGRARFLRRLAESVRGPQAVPLLRRLLNDRRKTGDDAGAELAARALLERNPGDVDAVEALCALLESHADRAEERAELLRLRFDLAKKKRDKKALPRAARELASQLAKLGHRADSLDVLRTTSLELPEDEGLFSEVSERLLQDGRDADLVKLVEELAAKTREVPRKVALLLKGAEVCRVRLKKLSRAQELVERALELSHDNVTALLARADIAQDLGDAAGALAPLERLAARLEDPSERARVHYRIGRLLEEHLLRPDDARRRYRAAVEGNPARTDAWEALLALAEQSRNRDDQVEALLGLARATREKQSATYYKEVARIERDERVDVAAAERALRGALAASPDDEEALEGLLVLVVARLMGEHDLDAALASPSTALLDELAPVLDAVVQAPRDDGSPLAPRVRRLYALTLGRRGEHERAEAELDALLKSAPTDLATLLSYARLLEGRAREEDEASARRKRLLETALLHHAPDLDDELQVRLWGEVGALRWFADERESARKALRKAIHLAVDKDKDSALHDGALEAAVSALRSEQGAARDARAVVHAQRLLASRWRGPEGTDLLLEAARVARDELGDRALCRALLEEAVRSDPDSRAPRKALLDLDVLEGDPEAATKSTLLLLESERDEKKRAALHAQVAELYKTSGKHEDASKHLVRALKLDPQSRSVQGAAEALFAERKDAKGLAALYAAQLKTMSKGDVSGRVSLLERLAQVRRYDLRDLAGAVEALEAITALEPEAIKPREDAARVYTELGQWREACAAWRGVLERDPLAVEAWRSVFMLYARTKQSDEAFSVAASMVAVEIADDEMVRAVRAIRPPFPRWPRAPKDPGRLKKRLGHPLEATPIRTVLDMVGPQVHRLYARPLKEFGLSRRERLAERQVPPSVMLAIRTARELLGLADIPPLYRAELGAVAGKTPPFALLPATEPGLVISDEALSGGMTPERAFALGRAMAWLMPHALLAGTLSTTQLKQVLSALVVRFIPDADVDGDARELEGIGHKIEAEIFRGLSGPRAESLRKGLLAALRDYVHARDQVHLADWMAGVNYTADRLGFLLSGDLLPSVRVIKAAASQGQQLGARLAIKELVLFSVSAPYFTLRRELGLSLPDDVAAGVLDDA